ncbi:hypothetical protein TNIN_78871 [Trichonephila inaurata madagascariensis]|uniref:Uncharacterized protein n=1 Tax=Trichonephila inaurata madagascariensis TaxID=2747483 RepID=A0A8X6XYV9_9ARAC|nr:hypothetical protein TNIN_78871 [Trichonephila inaurata madagascariensis]
MQEKVGNVKTNNKKPSKKQKKETRQSLSSSSEEISLDTSGDSFDKVTNDDFYAVGKCTVMLQQIPSVTQFRASNATNGYMKVAMIIICTE